MTPEAFPTNHNQGVWEKREQESKELGMVAMALRVSCVDMLQNYGRMKRGTFLGSWFDRFHNALLPSYIKNLPMSTYWVVEGEVPIGDNGFLLDVRIFFLGDVPEEAEYVGIYVPKSTRFTALIIRKNGEPEERAFADGKKLMVKPVLKVDVNEIKVYHEAATLLREHLKATRSPTG
jgi:hypothetical protein